MIAGGGLVASGNADAIAAENNCTKWSVMEMGESISSKFSDVALLRSAAMA